MTKGWNRPRGDGAAVPVELRFIDLYMAALGALLFLAMLFAYLLPNVPPPQTDRLVPDQTKQPLSIATTTLPGGVVGVAYNAAIAYRGGSGVVSWDLSNGASDLPTGVSFDKTRGVVAGTPSVARTSRIVIRVKDSAGAVVDQPYEVVFQPPPVKLDRAAWWVVLASFLGALVYTILFLRSMLGSRKNVEHLKTQYREGETVVHTGGPGGVQIRIELPEGIGTYEQYYFQEQRKFRFTLLAAAGLGVYLVYLWLKR